MANGSGKLTKTPLRKPGANLPATRPPFCFGGEGEVVAVATGSQPGARTHSERARDLGLEQQSR